MSYHENKLVFIYFHHPFVGVIVCGRFYNMHQPSTQQAVDNVHPSQVLAAAFQQKVWQLTHGCMVCVDSTNPELPQIDSLLMSVF